MFNFNISVFYRKRFMMSVTLQQADNKHETDKQKIQETDKQKIHETDKQEIYEKRKKKIYET